MEKSSLEMVESKSSNHESDHLTELLVPHPPVVYGTLLMRCVKEDKIWATCPYNKAHKVKPNRIQAHILKCEKVYPKLEICAYNFTHRFPKSEMNNHIANCPSKVLNTDNLTAKSSILLHHPRPNPAHETQPLDPDYECWD